MTEKECIKWLKIMRINLENFPEISNDKKIKALEKAIEIIERNMPYDNNDVSSNNV
jgi:hypothetical protein